jgi:hypothetical protein
MMLLVISAILASFAFGVTVAYGICNLLFTLFRMHVRASQPAPPLHARPGSLPL